MFTSRSNTLFNGRAIKVSVENDSAPVSFREVIHRWQNDSGFRAFFIGLLQDSPFSAFRWETPPVTSATADRPFEFVIVDSPEIALDPDPAPFAAHLKNRGPGEVVAFSNLGRDAILIAPCPADPLADYGHLAPYLRHAQESQQHRLWESVGAAMQRRISARPVWLNTAGGGVAWLHVRLDDRPKYYQYAGYCKVP